MATTTTGLQRRIMHMGYSKTGKRGFQPTHCLSNHPLYSAWRRIKNRCYNSNDKDYKDYGGRGIQVSELWKDDFVELLYWALKNGWEKGLTIERKNFNGNYEPSNCTWIPMSEQSKNRRGLHYIEHDGEKHTLNEWARITGISRSTLKERLNSNNYSVKEALTTPVNHNLARH